MYNNNRPKSNKSFRFALINLAKYHLYLVLNPRLQVKVCAVKDYLFHSWKKNPYDTIVYLHLVCNSSSRPVRSPDFKR